MRVKVMVSNVNRQQLAAWFGGWLYDCTVINHTGVWYDEKNAVNHVEEGATATFFLPRGEEPAVFETRLRGFLDRLGERYAWVEYDGEGRLV